MILAVPEASGPLEASSRITHSYVVSKGPHQDPLGGPLPLLQPGASISEVRAEEGGCTSRSHGAGLFPVPLLPDTSLQLLYSPC